MVGKKKGIFCIGFYRALIVVVAVLTLYGVYLFANPFAKEENVIVPDRMRYTKRYEGFEVKNIKFSKKGINGYISADIYNSTNKKYRKSNLVFILINNKGDVLTKKNVGVGSLKSKEKKPTKISMDLNKIKASYNFLVIKK